MLHLGPVSQRIHKSMKRLTYVTSILSTWDISVHSESAIDASDFATRRIRRYMGSHSFPQLVMESPIDNPIEIVSEDTCLASIYASDWCIGYESYGLSSSDDRCAFVAGKNVFDEAEIRDERMLMRRCRGRWTKNDSIISRCIQYSRVEIWRLTVGSSRGFKCAEALAESRRAGSEDGLVHDCLASVPRCRIGITEVPHSL